MKILWILSALTLIFTVPWFGPWLGLEPFLFSLPLWACVSLGMSIVFACLTAFLILREWKA